ncbi:MAG: 2-hydroxyacid dehydrogenase [Rhodospirillales bacterium]
MAEKIVVVDMLSDASAARLRALLPEGFVLTHGTARGDDHLKEILADADYAISGQLAVTGDVLRAAKKLKLLHKWGVGVDNLDIETARELGIKVARTTGSNAVSVAEFTLGLILATLRHIAFGHLHLQRGEWRGGRLPRDNFMLSKKTVGLVGFGAIGHTVAKLLAGFGCTILYTQRNRANAEIEAATGGRFVGLPELLSASDVVCLHCPLTPQTANMIDFVALSTMKRTAILINVARGGVVVEADLVRALREGIIHAAGMDVFSVEPLPADSILYGLDNLVITPHIAAMTADSFAPTVKRMFANIQAVSRGLPLPQGDVVV